MAGTDSPMGGPRYFEHFLVTAIGDLPAVDVQSATGVTTAILANQAGGVVEIPVATSNDDDVAAVSTNLNWLADANGTLVGEVRAKWDTSVADMFWFIGFGDSIASADETSFGATGDVYDILTMTDGVGFVFDNDATTPRIVCVAGKTNALTYQGFANGSSAAAASFTPVLGTYYTFRVEVGPGARSITWSINGQQVASTTIAPTSSASYVDITAPLALGVWNYEQATANELEVDYLYVERFGQRAGDGA